MDIGIRCAEDNVVYSDIESMAQDYDTTSLMIFNCCRKPGTTVKGKHFHWVVIDSKEPDDFSEKFDYMFLEQGFTRKELLDKLPKNEKLK